MSPTVDGDQTAAQNFARRHSKLASIHPFCDTSEKETLGLFQDCVRWHGAPDELVADNAAVYHGFKFMKYVCNLYVRLWQSQSYHQHQNFAENFWQSIKQGTNQLLDFSGAAKNLFLCALIYYAFLWNHTVDTTIGDGSSSPYTFATGCDNDITSILLFCFHEPMYCPLDQVQCKYNLDDILSKHWSHQASYKNLIRLIPYFHGDATYLINSVDILRITQHSLTTTPLDDECVIQIFCTDNFVLKDGHAMGSETNCSTGSCNKESS